MLCDYACHGREHVLLRENSSHCILPWANAVGMDFAYVQYHKGLENG